MSNTVPAIQNTHLDPYVIISLGGHKLVGCAGDIHCRMPKTGVRGRFPPFVTEEALDEGGSTDTHASVHVTPADEVFHFEFAVSQCQITAENSGPKRRHDDTNDARDNADESAGECEREQIAVPHRARCDEAEPNGVYVFSDVWMVALEHEHPIRAKNPHERKRSAEDENWTCEQISRGTQHCHRHVLSAIMTFKANAVSKGTPDCLSSSFFLDDHLESVMSRASLKTVYKRSVHHRLDRAIQGYFSTLFSP